MYGYRKRLLTVLSLPYFCGVKWVVTLLKKNYFIKVMSTNIFFSEITLIMGREVHEEYNRNIVLKT